METHCPYCNTVKIQRAGDIFNPDNTLQAIEIYCPYCHATLSITPLHQPLADA